MQLEFYSLRGVIILFKGAREHINKIRLKKYWIDENGYLKKGRNPLSSDLMDSIKHLSDGLYSSNVHFIFELIQNAEDNTYPHNTKPSLSFHLVQKDPTETKGSDGALIIHNNELGFSPENIEAICAIGKSTKKKNQGYIGEKGIGFKSVFKVTSKPHIISNGYSICFPEEEEITGLGYIVPQWVEKLPDKLINNSHTTIILPLNKIEINYSDVEKMLHDIQPEIILFLTKIKEIRIQTNKVSMMRIWKDDSLLPLVKIYVEKKRLVNSYLDSFEFLFFSKSFNRPPEIIQEKRENIREREVSIAFPINNNQRGIGKIFAYLPVRSDSGLPFLINGDFILPSSREDIRDVPWNRWLMTCASELVKTSLPELKERNLLKVNFLEALISRLNNISEDKDSIFYPIFVAVRDVLLNTELLPTDDKTFVSARNAKLARGEWLRKLLREEQLKQLFKTNAPLKWISSDVTESSILWKFFRNELKIDVIYPDTFARKVDIHFFEKQSDKWFIEFYRQLIEQRNLWKKRFTNSIWNGDVPLREKPIIRTQNGQHVKPFSDDGLPNVYLPIEINGDISLPVVKTKIADDKSARIFLKELGIPELDIVEEVIKYVIPKYSSTSKPPSLKDHLSDIDKIQHAYKTDSQDKKNRLYKALEKSAFILAEINGSNEITYRKPSEVYFFNEKLKIYFEGNISVGFVSSNYSDSLFNLFRDLGVRNKVKVIKKNSDPRGFVIIRDYYADHKRGLNGFDPDIQIEGLEHALKSPSLEKSAYIWNTIAIPNSDCIRGIVEKSTNQNYLNSEKKEVISEFGRLLMENSWLPDVNGVFKKPSQLYIDELPELFKSDKKLENLLGFKKNMVAELAEKVGIHAEDINFIKLHPEEFIQWKKSVSMRNEKPVFPTDAAHNLERRKEQIFKQIKNASIKEYEKTERSVRTSRGSIDPNIWLRNKYTNKNDEMICQICKNVMPFKKRDGEYYFEAVEALSRDFFKKEHEAQFLALCPLCAAMYKEFVKNDENTMNDLYYSIKNNDKPEIELRLGNLKTSIKFVEVHFSDLKVILG